MSNTLQLFNNITTFIFDVDGVLTDGTLLILPNGVMARTMNVKDGYAIQLAIKKGYKVAIISGGNSTEVKERLEILGVTEIYMRVHNKLEVLQKIKKEQKLSSKQILYMGDDMPDIATMQNVGLPCCPADAIVEVKSISKYISTINGGKGCARDVIEKVLKLANNWEPEVEVASN
jgi:3-deoxy-D-manno-octulosonate 8-phosphate phosphatase (KDO 8-P phosphatase)